MKKNLWTLEVTCDDLNNRVNANMVHHLGIVFTEIGPDYLKATMPVDHRTMQIRNKLHGGASVVLAETLGSVAAWLSAQDPLNTHTLGVEISASHLRTVDHGYVIGVVKPVKVGRTLQVWEIEIVNEDHQPICRSRLTTMNITNTTNE